MTGFSVDTFLTGLGVSAGAVLVVFAAAWVVGVAVGRFNVVDVAWGVGFAAVAAASYAWSGGDGDPVRRALALALTATWALRLAGYIGWRSRGEGEDPRYAEMLDRAPGSRALYALRSVFAVQAVALWVVSLPVQAAMAETDGPDALVYIGGIAWAVGMFFEVVGDAQLARFRADPDRGDAVLDRGLWRYTRHPNYFGDACVWWGLYGLACGHWIGDLTIVGPALMTWFLARKTGAPLLERRMREAKPGYTEYVRRTSGFVPLPPRG